MTIREAIKEYTLHNLGMTSEEYNALKDKSFGMDEKVRKKFYAIVKNSDHIDILGDYDCDGVTSTYIMYKLMTSTFHKDTGFLIPNRITDGYGIQKKLIDRLYERRKDALDRGEVCTIVTVDNGIAGAEPIAYAKELGFRVIVTDHHEQGLNEIPRADLVIDPKAKDCNPFDYDGYCGAGVAYKIAEQFVKNPKFLRHLRSFAALGTVADVMELTGDNYKIVKTALNELSNGIMPTSWRYLGKAYNTFPNHDFAWEDITEKDFGFMFGPIINAQSRMEDAGATKAEKYLLHPTEEMAKEMVKVNETRKDLTKTLYAGVEKKIEETGLKSPLWVYIPQVNEGIIGILAGNITERFGVPCIVLTDTEDEKVLKGSARSIQGFDIFDYLCSLPKEYFVGFGGHTGAAGLSVYRDKLEEIQNLPDLSVYAECDHLEPNFVIDQDEMEECYHALREFAPFGQGNPAPLFGVHMNPMEKKPYLCGSDKNTALFFGDHGKVTVFRYKDMLGDINPNKPFLAVGELNAERYKGNKGINLIASELKDERTLEKEKGPNLQIR
jgi:single-stranded-DNA-specific exonuclease